MKTKISVQRLTIIAVLSAISFVLGSTPLGFIPVGPIFATTMHIPVIIGAILEGPVVGGFVGLFFGLFSMARGFLNPTPTSFIMMDPRVSVITRVLMGVLTGLLYQKISKFPQERLKKILVAMWGLLLAYNLYRIVEDLGVGVRHYSQWILSFVLIAILIWTIRRKPDRTFSLWISAAAGSAMNTIFVLSMVYLLYAVRFVEQIGRPASDAFPAILGIAVTNGVPELILVTLISGSVLKILQRKRT